MRFYLITFLLISFLLQPVYAQELSNKTIPAEVEQAVIQALAYFPDLDSYSIEFKYRKKLKNRVMQAQPKIRTLLRNKTKRHYKITMSQNLVMKDTVMSITELPNEILVGWFAHELGHIMDYKDRSSGNMIKFGLKYVTSKPFIKSSELRADALAADNGCAKHLIKTKRFILFKSRFTKAYKNKIKELYPSPEDITAMLTQ